MGGAPFYRQPEAELGWLARLVPWHGRGRARRGALETDVPKDRATCVSAWRS